jgi:hypothetical protein
MLELVRRPERTGRQPVLVAVAGAVCLCAAVLYLLFGRDQAPRAPFTPVVLGGQPPGAVVLSRESGAFALGLAVKQEVGRVLLVATVIGPDRNGVGGLAPRFALATSGGATLQARGIPCTSGCYAATVELPAGRPVRVAVSLRGRPTAVFELPRQWPAPSGVAAVRRAEAAYGRLHSYVTRQRLGSDATHVVHTIYRAIRPDRLSYSVRGGPEAVIVGPVRWDRFPGGSWIRSSQDPVTPVAAAWTRPVTNASLLGNVRLAGRPVWVVSFVNPGTPAFFTARIDERTGETVQVEMNAAGHFMRDDYGAFDAPFSITPPR